MPGHAMCEELVLDNENVRRMFSGNDKDREFFSVRLEKQGRDFSCVWGDLA